MSQENVALVRKTFVAFENGGFEAMLPFFPPDIVWHPAPGWVEDPIYRGYDGVRKMSATFTENFEDLVLEPQEIRDLEDRVLVLAEAKVQIEGTAAPIIQPYGMVYSDFRDGMIGDVRFFFTWQEALEAVGVQE